MIQLFSILSVIVPLSCICAQSSAPELNEKAGSPSIKGPSTNEATYTTLIKFLSAQNYKERAPFLAPSKYKSLPNFSQGVLNKPLPKYEQIALTNRIHNATLNRSEYFYSVKFETLRDQKRITPSSIFIQISDWGDDKTPRIHTDAFLDLYTNRLKSYSSEPSEEILTFHAVVESYRYCFDEHIPNREKMGFLKIKAHPHEPALFKAYFSLDSELARVMEQPTGLPWGVSGIATITVKWDQKNAEHPYLRLIKINGFSWDP